MSDAKKANRKPDRTESRLLLGLVGRLERYMARAGLIAFAVEGDGTPAGDAPTGGAPAGDKPTGDVPAGDKPTGDAPTGDKPTGDKPAGDKPSTDKPAAPAAPEKYEFTLPEGVKLDEPTMGKFTEIAKGLNLQQADAQKLVDLHTSMQAEGLKAQETAITEFYADIGGTPDKWPDAAKADKEIGGDKFDANLAVAKAALDKFGTPELNAVLLKTGLGSHPELLRAFFRAGQAISQDGFVPGRSGTSKDARNLYANSNMNP